ncbi:hypothetical protein [Nocardioides sp.]|nr:hypothetical protein [Nocardioides sp.]MDI6909678.1 hypothetical protein [Nocardioides sp.]
MAAFFHARAVDAPVNAFASEQFLQSFIEEQVERLARGHHPQP